MKNYAFIDAQNLYYGMKSLGWKLDYKRFRIYLKEKYKVEVAYLFMGEIPEYKSLYFSMEAAGFILNFKEILRTRDGKVKGNVDAEIVLQAMIDYPNYEKAVIISSDGDFSCLVKYLYSKDKLETVMSPQINKSSFLLRKAAKGRITFIAEFKERLIYRSG
ncbi:MAG TPA: NYN domain-containing protein [bacterium]|nr:NYN domain-containing protein [bacterium]